MRNIIPFRKYNENTESETVSTIRSIAPIAGPHTAKEEAEERIQDLQDNLLADDECRTISPNSTLNSETPASSIQEDDDFHHIKKYDDFGNDISSDDNHRSQPPQRRIERVTDAADKLNPKDNGIKV